MHFAVLPYFDLPQPGIVGRFHNIYGPYGTWKGGREKAPAAFCRKVLTSTKDIEMWGDGKQTRSFTYIDDCVEGILRITKSDFKEPLNLGSSEMVSMNGMMETICQFDGRSLPIRFASHLTLDISLAAVNLHYFLACIACQTCCMLCGALMHSVDLKVSWVILLAA